MVKWPFQGVKWPPTTGSKGHFESPGIDFFLLGSNLPIIEAGSTFPARGFSLGGVGWRVHLKLWGGSHLLMVWIKLSTKTEASSTGCRGSSKSFAKGASGRERAMNRAYPQVSRKAHLCNVHFFFCVACFICVFQLNGLGARWFRICWDFSLWKFLQKWQWVQWMLWGSSKLGTNFVDGDEWSSFG